MLWLELPFMKVSSLLIGGRYNSLVIGCWLLVVGIWLVGSIQPTTGNRQRI